jgi:hypothetical protein
VVRGLLWKAQDSSTEPSAALVVRAECVAGPCFIIFFTFKGLKVVAIAPSQPSPFCILGSSELQQIVERILGDLGFRIPYRSACILSKYVIRDSISETIQSLIDYEIVKKVEEPGENSL